MSNEIEILQSLNHKNIIKLFDVVEDKDSIQLIMEYIPGQDLFSIIEAATLFQDDLVSGLSEVDAKAVFSQVLEGVRYLHANQIVHNDLKPENIWISGDKDQIFVKILDFGLSAKLSCKDAACHSGSSGTVEYAAPELSAKFSSSRKSVKDMLKADCWSLGILLYVMLFAEYPSFGEAAGRLFLAEHRRSSVSPSAWDLLSRLLTLDPSQRLSALDALNHDWVSSRTSSSSHQQ